MISCAQFIPAYSELFRYIDEKYGYSAVENFWAYLFKPDGKGIPLVNFVRREGLRGCFSYWSGTLNEEAASFTMYLDEKRGYFLIEMHRCPSKGRLIELSGKSEIEPYANYCLHCDYYRHSIEPFGLKYLFNFAGVDRACCSILVYDPELFDGRIIVDSNTVIMNRDASDNDYFHRDFHSSTNGGIEYLKTTFGKESVEEYLRIYTDKLYSKRVAGRGLAAIREVISESYALERAEELVRLEESGGVLTVTVGECPAIRHLKATGRSVSDYFYLIDEVSYSVLAELAGVEFETVRYNRETGSAVYRFSAKI